MSNAAYPVGSIYRNRDLWESLPRESNDRLALLQPRLFTGLFWALVVEASMGMIGWLFWELSR
jgi:hypothetical protein